MPSRRQDPTIDQPRSGASTRGRLIVLVGPDGAGKSTVADGLAAALAETFPRVWRYHWRPMVLPRPGDIRGTAPRDTSRPHEAPPHPRLLSWGLLLYYWLDFLLGHALRFRPACQRGELVLLERGWYDMAVDPRRYRLDVPPRLVEFLGRLVPRPDAGFVLDGEPATLHGRKPELPVDEISRQRVAWRRLVANRRWMHLVSVDQPLADVVTVIAQAPALERSGADSPAGWVALPTRRRPRVHVPSRPPAATADGLRIYQPTAGLARLATAAVRGVARTGVLSLLPPDTVPDEVARRLAPYVPTGGTYALLHSNHPGRYIARVLDARTRPVAVVKVVDDSGDPAPLEREAAALNGTARDLRPPVSAPGVLGVGVGVLALAPVTPRARRRPWVLPLPVAAALGTLWASGADAPDVGPAQGDCAPWNLLRTTSGWVLIDWEHHAVDAMPFADVMHFLVQGYAMVGHPTRDELLRGVHDLAGWVGAAVRAHAEAAGLRAADAGASLRQYLMSPNPIVQPGPDGQEPEGHRARILLLDALP